MSGMQRQQQYNIRTMLFAVTLFAVGFAGVRSLLIWRGTSLGEEAARVIWFFVGLQ
jgi:hypothetical protein